MSDQSLIQLLKQLHPFMTCEGGGATCGGKVVFSFDTLNNAQKFHSFIVHMGDASTRKDEDCRSTIEPAPPTSPTQTSVIRDDGLIGRASTYRVSNMRDANGNPIPIKYTTEPVSFTLPTLKEIAEAPDANEIIHLAIKQATEQPDDWRTTLAAILYPEGIKHPQQSQWEWMMKRVIELRDSKRESGEEDD